MALIRPMTSTGTIAPSRFVKTVAGTDEGVAQAGANEAVHGVAQNYQKKTPTGDATSEAASTGDPIGVYTVGDECLLEIGATVAVGDLLKADTLGKGIPIASSGTTLQQYGAKALQAGSYGQKIRVHVLPGSVYPALA